MSEKGTNTMQRTEWIGDATLRLFVSLALNELYPGETTEGLRGMVDCYINNAILRRFYADQHLPYGGNQFERTLGNYVLNGQYEKARLMCCRLVIFADKAGAPEQFKARMVQKNKAHALKPVPCGCGSMNLRFWRRPRKVVCMDCSIEYVPTHRIDSAQQLIFGWNEWRKQARLHEPSYAG